jgi:serine/threonine protein kinase
LHQPILFDGKFRLESKISEGGFGKVYVARDVSTNQKYALKINSCPKINIEEF